MPFYNIVSSLTNMHIAIINPHFCLLDGEHSSAWGV
jgi:hypothetical protein